MIKYFIYELKKDIKTLLFTNILLIILIGGLPYNTKYETLGVGISLLVSAYILFLIYRCINLLVDDLFSNKRFFIFSLPISKENIVLGKYLYAIFYILTTLVALFISALILQLRSNNDFAYSNIFEGALSAFAASILFYSFIYFMMSLGKILFNSKHKSTVLASIGTVIGLIIYTNITSEIFTKYVYTLQNFYEISTYFTIANIILSLIFTSLSALILKKYLDV